MQVTLDPFVVGSWQQVNSVDLGIAKLTSGQTFDVGFTVLPVIVAMFPGLLLGLHFLREKLLHALVGVPFVILSFDSFELHLTVLGTIEEALTPDFCCLRSAISPSNSKTCSCTAVAIYDFIFYYFCHFW